MKFVGCNDNGDCSYVSQDECYTHFSSCLPVSHKRKKQIIGLIFVIMAFVGGSWQAAQVITPLISKGFFFFVSTGNLK